MDAVSAAASAETGLFLDGLRCAGCVARVERALRAMGGVETAQVNHTTHRALVRFDPARASVPSLVEEVRALGYDATPFDPDALERPATREARRALIRLLVAAFLAANVMMLSLALYFGTYWGIDPATRRALRWLGLALSLPAVVWCAAPFWRGAIAGLRRGEITLDVPVALGVGTAYGASIAGTLSGATHVFLDSAAMIVFLILLGRTLERSARAKASRAVERLVALAPATALRCGPNGVETVLAHSLVVGDHVVVAPGEAFPADGVIAMGDTEVDEALWTGESNPVARRTGEAVTGGTRNVLAEVEVEIRAAAREGTLARLVALLERAQLERPRIQLLADRVASVFAPAVLLITAATALGWLAGVPRPSTSHCTASAVLIVACPCALGLATPAAMTAALGRAARFGVLFKSGEAIERCARVDTVLLDKTGTLTEGRLAVERIATAAASARPRCCLAPLRSRARRRIRSPRRCGARPSDAGSRRTRRAKIGARSPAAASSRGARSAWRWSERARCWTSTTSPWTLGLEIAAAQAAGQGASLAWVAEAGRALGVVSFVDPVRPDAREAVARMRKLGLAVALVSGDHAGAVALAASAAGIEDHSACVVPEQKVAAVLARRAAGACVLLAGDGINDAAALAAADVGVAMARGAEVAVHAADVVVRAPRVGAIADWSRSRVRRCGVCARTWHARRALQRVAVPLAALGWLDPLPAAVAMSLSSLVVTGNAVRLLGWQPPR